MALVGLINTLSYREGKNEIDDVLFIVEDEYKPDPNEYTLYNIIKISGTKRQVINRMKAAMPEQENVYKDGETWRVVGKEPHCEASFKAGKFVSNLNRYSENQTSIGSKSG